ncbi:serine hydrolase [Novosphingobium sp.]|uniref:serine hydrolase domain-containing protein n=1 Tax=Novosphingobium sp. TaxID=1874826 RepID=UPI002734E73A|nr:serine hydrolase [Novosphingobium sp.]MDP3907467.1 serine hydrolase [Novosphingobium sp.]
MTEQRAVLDAHTSDPAVMGWMQGFPPAPDKHILAASAGHMRFPTHRFAFSRMREFLPTARVARGHGAIREFPVALRDDLDDLTFTALDDGREMTWAQSLPTNFTDAILVLHRGTIVYERYFGVTRRATPHIVFSVTKSFVGTLAEMLVHEGRLDPATPVGDLLPELRSSGFADATLRQVLDMTTALDFSEDYTDASSGIGAFSLALGLTPRPAGYAGPTNVYDFLPTIGKAGEHGERFTYRTCNTEVLGWIVARTEGKRLDKVLAERIWQPLGMEQDADFLIDSTGMPFAGGGLNPVLHDLARFGETMRCDGVGHGGAVIPLAAIESIRAGADRAAFAKAGYGYLPDCSYRSQWWTMPGNHGTYAARGIHGQGIYIDPVAEMVIVRFGSHPIAASSGNDPVSLPAYRAVAERLMQR